MRILIAASGSYGDILPFVALGRELERREHEVLFFAGAHFEAVIRGAGLSAVPIGPPEAYEAIIRHPDAFHPRRGFRLIARASMQYLADLYREMEARVVPGNTIVLGSTLAFGTRLIQEALAVPTAVAHLAPSIFRSAHRPPRVTERSLPRWFPPALNRLLFRIVDALFVDPTFCRELNRFRAELGLAPVKRVFHHWIHEADAVVGLFPEWFAEPQPDWPEKLRLTGFPLYDGGSSKALPEDIERFFDDGPPPVIFTTGTAATSEREFFEESVAACRLAGARGILLTRYRGQLPRELPAAVRHVDYLPFSRVLPRAAAIVHHGGIGTSSQALAASLPQLVRPLAYDQFDNALRLEALGVARTLSPRRYRAATVAGSLEELTGSPEVRDACVAVRGRIEGYDAVRETCDVVLAELRRG